MNLLILTILIYRNGHFISIRLLQMERRSTCLLHILLEILLRSSFQHPSNSLLLKRAREAFWEHYEANGRMNDKIISFRVLPTFTNWTKSFHCMYPSGTWNSPPHPPLNSPLQKFNFLFPIFLIDILLGPKIFFFLSAFPFGSIIYYLGFMCYHLMTFKVL